MKTQTQFLLILLLISMHFGITNSLYGQCTGCTTTVNTSSNATYNLSTGEKLCITAGTFTGDISLNGTSELCIGSGVTVEPSSVSFFKDSHIENYGEWTWESGGTTISFGANLNNYGSLTINGDITLTNTSTFNHAGTLLSISGHVNNNNSLTISADATFGSLQNNNGKTITINDAELTVTGDFQNNGIITASGSSTCGQLSVGGISQNTNNGDFGVDGSNLDICDADGDTDGFNQNFGDVGGAVTNCTCEGLLPLYLIDFHISAHTLASVLQWRTAWEENTSHFEIEGSDDGRFFQYIGQIDAQGHSQQIQEYQYPLNENFYVSNSYFRLKMVDLDQSFTYSKIIHAMSTQQPSPFPSFHYNNTYQLLEIQYPNTAENPLSIQLYHIGGKLLSEIEINRSQQIKLEGFPIGVYLVYYENQYRKGFWRLLKQE